MKVEDSLPQHSSAWRAAMILLIFALACDAISPTIAPPRAFVLGSYFLLGLVCTAAFPTRAWIGILVAFGAAVGFELLQWAVPMRGLRGIELVAKWGAALAGVLLELALVTYLQAKRKARWPS